MYLRTARILLLLVLLLNIGDYFLTNFALSIRFEEGNPFLAGIVDTFWFPVIKLLVVPALILLAMSLGSRISHRRFAIYSAIAFLLYCTPYISVLWGLAQV